MSTHRTFARAVALTATVSITGLLGAGIASAHVTANVYGPPPEQGGYTAITMRVPNEDEKLGTTKLSVAISEDYALGSARTKPVPGWKSQVVKTKLDKPVPNGSGDDVAEVVTQIVWTAEPGNEISSDQYQEFSFSAGPLPADVDALVLPSTQTYEGGKVVKWDEPPADGKELERPAPVVELAESTGGHGGGARRPEAHAESESASHDGTDTTARWLGGLGLAVGALGLGFGAGATMRARKAVKKV